MAQKVGIKVITDERLRAATKSVIGQAANIIPSTPGGLVGAAGGPTVLPETTLVERSYKGQIYQSRRRARRRLHPPPGEAVEGTVMAAPAYEPVSRHARQQPVEEGRGARRLHRPAYGEVYNTKPAHLGRQQSPTPGCCCKGRSRSAKKGKPGTPIPLRAARCARETKRQLVATQGVYDMTPPSHSGFDKRGADADQGREMAPDSRVIRGFVSLLRPTIFFAKALAGSGDGVLCAACPLEPALCAGSPPLLRSTDTHRPDPRRPPVFLQPRHRLDRSRRRGGGRSKGGEPDAQPASRGT